MSENSVTKVFVEKCEDVINSRFIIADKKIQDLLKEIVTNKAIYAVLERCLNNFNYEMEFMKARLPLVEGQNKFVLALPEDSEKLVAFVFCLLHEIEDKTRDFQKFLQDFFYNNGSYFEGYSEFCVKVIRPFMYTMCVLLKGTEGTLESEAKETKFFGTDFVHIDEPTLNMILEICDQMALMVETIKNKDIKPEKEFIIEAFKNAIITKDRKLIKTAYIGLIYSLKGFKPAAKNVAKAERLLKDLWVI